MSTVRELHNQAMDLAEEALRASRKGKATKAKELFAKALDFEKQASDKVISNGNAEPTRSILLRSAASLALNCNKFREAEQLIATALAGNPPQQVAEELRDLLEQVYFQRHLDLRGITLESNELQFSISGGAVGAGWALSNSFIDRVKYFEKLVYRTAERILGKDFREKGNIDKFIRENFSLFLSPLRVGSLAVTFRLGRQKHPLLPGMEEYVEKDYTNEVMNEVVDCLVLLNESNETALKERINDDAYFRNFVGLARQIAPDGEDVSQVGLTIVENGDERRISLIRPKIELTSNTIEVPPIQPKESKHLVTVKGRLLFADHRVEERGIIKLQESNGQEHDIVVPEGMMSDIVRPLWEFTVEVTGLQSKKKILLEDIRKVED